MKLKLPMDKLTTIEQNRMKIFKPSLTFVGEEGPLPYPQILGSAEKGHRKRIKQPILLEHE
jgi:hypothetical protein